MQNYILKMKYQRNLEKYFEVIDTEDTAQKIQQSRIL